MQSIQVEDTQKNINKSQVVFSRKRIIFEWCMKSHTTRYEITKQMLNKQETEWHLTNTKGR